MKKVKTVRFKSREEKILIVNDPDEKEIRIVCTPRQEKEFASLADFLLPDITLNLICPEINADGSFQAEFIVFEPDYLIDISALAECFKPYGNHPLNYTLSRLRCIENTKHILLGNTANFFIDELINEQEEKPVIYREALQRLFKSAPFEFSACKDLSEQSAELAFFSDCQKQFLHIKKIIKEDFPKEKIDKHKVILEPSFICNTLGLQGRLDLLVQDFSGFVELKSGKGTEDFRSGRFIGSAANHYTQMILYLALLEFNMGMQPEKVNSYLLYSKYPVLSKEAHSEIRLREALEVRNAIVATEYAIQKKNDWKYTAKIINKISPEELNTAELQGNFFEKYLRPTIEKTQRSIASLHPTEQVYFMRFYTFLVKELWLSKLGSKEYEGVKRAANLWNAPAEEKIAAGEFLYDLRIIDNQAASDNRSVTLAIPEYDGIYLPNFRPGDAVVLYVRNSEADNVNNKQVFKGAIDRLDAQRITIRLRAKQNNISILPETARYALEHDYPDITYHAGFRALNVFAEALQERRDLLLNRRMPCFDPVESYENEDIGRVAAKAGAAKDCFLLIGPPGTGKTSLALRKMVEACLQRQENILLLSYTNRAVDEMCKALTSIDDSLHFIRIGNELNCCPEYRNKLLEKQLDHCSRRTEVKEMIRQCPIFVGTVASIWNRPELFKLKRFHTAIIDEATQLLEPHLLGILCSKTKKNENAVGRFILIGDHKQLPAVVLQSDEESRVKDPELRETGLLNLKDSLFERLYRYYKKNGIEAGYDILTRQGRMHPDIASFPSIYFYENQLKCAGLPHQSESLPEPTNENQDVWTTLAASRRLAFISAKEFSQGNKTNHTEATIAVNIATALFNLYKSENKTIEPDTLGIITPYRNQMALIRKKLQETGIPELNERVIIDTVERFQGSQKEVIIYSFCINDAGQLNFLPNIIMEDETMIDRKLNVVLTRAKKQLFITGNAHLLSQNKLYNTLLNHIRDHGILIEV